MSYYLCAVCPLPGKDYDWSIAANKSTREKLFPVSLEDEPDDDLEDEPDDDSELRRWSNTNRICRAKVILAAQNTVWVRGIEILEKLQNNKMFSVVNQLKKELLSADLGTENSHGHFRVLKDLCVIGNVSYGQVMDETFHRLVILEITKSNWRKQC